MLVQVKPLDTLFFRDGKPFGMGEESWTSSSILPNPSVFWGAFYSMLLYTDENLSLALKDQEKLKLGRMYLYNEKDKVVLIPAPLDLYELKGKKDEIVHTKFDNDDCISNFEFKYLAFPDVDNKEVKTLSDQFIDINSVAESYKNKGRISLYPLDKVAEHDYKLGIGRDNSTFTTQEGNLYRIELTQFQDNWSFLIELEFEGTIPKKGIIKLGGEGKVASFSVLNDDDIPYTLKSYRKENAKSSVEKFFKLLLISPTFFKSGWGKDELESIGFKVISAFVDKPLSIGGFDVKEKRPKAMRKAVPSGSIYYLENLDKLSFQEVYEKISKILTQNNETETIKIHEEIIKGFGQFEILPLK